MLTKNDWKNGFKRNKSVIYQSEGGRRQVFKLLRIVQKDSKLLVSSDDNKSIKLYAYDSISLILRNASDVPLKVGCSYGILEELSDYVLVLILVHVVSNEILVIFTLPNEEFSIIRLQDLSPRWVLKSDCAISSEELALKQFTYVICNGMQLNESEGRSLNEKTIDDELLIQEAISNFVSQNAPVKRQLTAEELENGRPILPSGQSFTR